MYVWTVQQLQELAEYGYLLATEERGWVDVKERLPEKNSTYNSVFVLGFVPYAIPQVTMCYYDYESGGWVSRNSFLGVTHWQPLPIAPTEKTLTKE